MVNDRAFPVDIFIVLDFLFFSAFVSPFCVETVTVLFVAASTLISGISDDTIAKITNITVIFLNVLSVLITLQYIELMTFVPFSLHAPILLTF